MLTEVCVMLLTREEIQNRGSTNQSATRISVDFSTSFPGERAWERGCRLHSSAGRIESILSARRKITVGSYEFCLIDCSCVALELLLLFFNIARRKFRTVCRVKNCVRRVVILIYGNTVSICCCV